jgi:hypothetical protein
MLANFRFAPKDRRPVPFRHGAGTVTFVSGEVVAIGINSPRDAG